MFPRRVSRFVARSRRPIAACTNSPHVTRTRSTSRSATLFTFTTRRMIAGATASTYARTDAAFSHQPTSSTLTTTSIQMDGASIKSGTRSITWARWRRRFTREKRFFARRFSGSVGCRANRIRSHACSRFQITGFT